MRFCLFQPFFVVVLTKLQNDSKATNFKLVVLIKNFLQHPVHIYNGKLLWKIESYQRKRQDAINGLKTALYSPPFYSAQYGYKMCAKIYMNGDGFGRGSHLSLFFVVMKGELMTYVFGDLGLSPT